MASRTLVREKLRAKHRERQENEVAKRTVVMCARLRRSLPLCEAGQLNIAALVGRWIDGHYRKAGYSKKFRAEHEAGDVKIYSEAELVSMLSAFFHNVSWKQVGNTACIAMGEK